MAFLLGACNSNISTFILIINILSGQYMQQFVEVGTYYVWSGFVDSWDIKNYVGTINVVNANSTHGEINVRVGIADAKHTIGGKHNKHAFC